MTTRTPRLSALAALAALAAVGVAAVMLGCAAGHGTGHRGIAPGKPTIQIAELRVVEGAAGSALQIDDSYHDTVTVFPGDRVEWRCSNCPAGTEFTVTSLHFDSEVKRLAGMTKVWGRSDHAPPGPCAELEADAPPRRAVDHPLFGGGWHPPGAGVDWVAHDQAIVSQPVAIAGVKHGMWKYTWKVRKAGDPASELCWDPHIFGHTDKAF